MRLVIVRGVHLVETLLTSSVPEVDVDLQHGYEKCKPTSYGTLLICTILMVMTTTIKIKWHCCNCCRASVNGSCNHRVHALKIACSYGTR